MKTKKKWKVLRTLLSILLCITMVLPDLGVFTPESVKAAEDAVSINLLEGELTNGIPKNWTITKNPTITCAYDADGSLCLTDTGTELTASKSQSLNRKITITDETAGEYTLSGLFDVKTSSKGKFILRYAINGNASADYKTVKNFDYNANVTDVQIDQPEIVLKSGDILYVDLQLYYYNPGTHSADIKVKNLELKKKVVEQETPEVFDGGLLVNGGFADDLADVTSNYNNGVDGKAEAWQYWTNAVLPKTTLIENGLTVEALSVTNGAAERVTIQQTVTGLTAGKTYRLTGAYDVSSTSKGSFSIDVKDIVTVASRTSKTDGWQTFSQDITVPAGATSVQIRIIVSSGAELTASVKEFKFVEVEEKPEVNKDLLVNGNFADDLADVTSNYNNGVDGKAEAWQYWTNAVLPKITLIENGLTVEALSVTNGAAERVTIQQTVTGLTAGKTYRLTGAYDVSSTSKGSFSIDVKDIVTVASRTSKTDGWQTFSQDITVPAGATSVQIRIIVSSGAELTASVKEFKFTEVSGDTPEEEPDDNLLINPKYEDANADSKADSWNYYSNKGAEANYNSSSKDGVFTAKMNGTGTLVLHQTVKLGTDGLNKKYTFTGEMKVTDLTNSYASFRIQLVDASNKGLGTTESERTKAATTEWIPVKIEFEVPEASAGAAVAGFKVEHYIDGGIGTVEFRKVKVVETGVMENLPEGDPIDTLIYNGGYEKTASGMPASWSLWQSTGGLKATSDRTVKYEGYSSLHMEEVTSGTNSRGSVHQTFTVTEDLKYLTGQSLKITQWVKTEGFSGSGVSIRVHDPANTLGTGTVVATKTIPLATTQDWTLYEYILDLPSYPLATIKVEYLYDSCQGDVWIDSTRVTGYVRATGIEVEDEPFVLKVNDEHQIKLQFAPVNATVQKVKFTNSNDSVISVDEQGLIKALKNGTSVITITQEDGIKKEVAVLVCDEELTYEGTVTVNTKQNERQIGTLSAGYTYKVSAAAQHGTFLVEEGNQYIYYPDKDYVGSDVVTLIVEKDGAQTLVPVAITVAPVNAAPECSDFNVLTNVDETVTGKITVTDPENDEIVFEVAVNPAHGTFTLDGANYTFVPEKGYTGYDSAVIYVKDGHNTTEVEAKIYIAASVESILSTVKDDHSRLLADNTRFEEIKKLIETDANAKAWFEEIKADLDPLLADTTPVPFECPDGLRLNTQGSKDVLNMAFMYRVTGDMRYYERACLELNSLCNIYPHWNPVHLLDTAMTANGVAIAYDWLYDALKENDPELLKDVETALYKFGLQEAKKQFEANHMFVTNLNNWNYVCNGGFATTALALAHHENEEYNALAGEILQRCYKSIQYGLPQYAPEGDSIEGISYWDYGTRYLVSCLASISSATTVENPFISAPGLYETAQYPIYMTGKAGTYNYSDNDMTPAWGYLNLWLANEFDTPAYTWYHKDYVANNGTLSIYDLLYYYPEQYEADAPEELDKYYTSQAVTTMRHDFEEDPNSSFLGFKGGLNGAAHGDLDIGSFVYDIYGIRWAFDFGKEDYNLTGYWEIVDGGTRWNYYRKNALGHNTLVINPEKGANQVVGAYAGAVEQSLNNPGGGYTILDMTDAYQKNAVDVRRGFAYFNRTQVLIRDEFTLKESSEIYWQMHTEAVVTISEDGKVATLTKDGKSIELRLFDEDGSDYQFETMAAVAYDGIGTAEGENPNEGVTKLFIKATDVQKGVFNVLITPVEDENPEILELKDWNTYDFSKLATDDSEPEDPKPEDPKPEDPKPENPTPSVPSDEVELDGEAIEVEDIVVAEKNGQSEVVKENNKEYVVLTNTAMDDVEIKGEADVLDEDAFFVRKYLTTGKAYEDAQKFVKENIKGVDEYKVLEFNLYSKTGSEITELDGYVYVTIPMPEGITVDEGKVLVVYRINDDGAYTNCNATCKDGKITFVTNHFSTYIIAEQDKAVVAPVTGDNSMVCSYVLFLLIGCAAMIIAMKKSKRII